MAISFDLKERIITPRWRNFDRLKLSGDHLPFPVKNFVKPEFSNNTFIQDKVADWNISQNLGNAWDLVQSAYVTDDYSIGIEAARFLKDSNTRIPFHLNTFVSEILGEDITVKLGPTNLDDENISSLTMSVIKKIRIMKSKLRKNIRNEFLWIELARLYSILGNNNKADRCVTVALQLSNSINRFILRSASRFYSHLGDFERAQKIVKASPYFKNDPLLISAEISYASKLNRSSKFMKLGFEHVDSKRYSDSVISELSGMLGTVELKNAAIKSARKLTKTSLKDPNDNSLAQAEWIARQIHGIEIDPELNNLEYAFEARAFENLYSHDYKAALQEGVDWVIDQPFSRRAYRFVSYVCVSLLNNYDLAIEVCYVGLHSNPENFGLLNNLAFAYASIGELDKARKLLPRMNLIVTEQWERVYYYAMEAYLYYKEKDYDNGALKYKEAIDYAESIKEKELKYLAEAHFVHEKFIAKQMSFSLAKERIRELQKKGKSFDIEAQGSVIIASMEHIDRKELIR